MLLCPAAGGAGAASLLGVWRGSPAATAAAAAEAGAGAEDCHGMKSGYGEMPYL